MILAIRLVWVLFASMVRISTIGVATAIIEFFFDRLEDLIDRYIIAKSQPVVIIQ
jgi:hypothetical protein|tara:strand:+ start:470 stop:634 length:165 start_codon:yes stop_codon:yes gene_type:complete